MIKHINHQNFSTTPFVAAKSWDLYNAQNEDTVLIEQDDSISVAIDYIDYNTGIPLLNRECNLALEQQDADILYYEEGVTGSGLFDPDIDPKNYDGTYKRLVHIQVENAFYNKRNNPSQIFGVEYIDFPISRTKRYLSDHFRMFTIPRDIFGEKIKPLSVYFYDTALDDNVTVHDDGYQNLNAGFDLFSKVQEIRTYIPPTGSNSIQPGSASCSCLVYDDVNISASVSDNMYVSVEQFYGSLKETPRVDTSSFGMGFYSGSLATSASTDDAGMSFGFVYGSLTYRIERDNMVIGQAGSQNMGFDHGHLFETIVPISPQGDTGSINITFFSGSIFDQIVWCSGSQDTSSINITFFSGSIFNEVVTISSSDSSSIFMGYESGYIANVSVETPRRYAYQTMSIAFLNGTSSIVSASIGYATSSNGTIVPHP